MGEAEGGKDEDACFLENLASERVDAWMSDMMREAVRWRMREGRAGREEGRENLLLMVIDKNLLLLILIVRLQRPHGRRPGMPTYTPLVSAAG